MGKTTQPHSSKVREVRWVDINHATLPNHDCGYVLDRHPDLVPQLSWFVVLGYTSLIVMYDLVQILFRLSFRCHVITASENVVRVAWYRSVTGGVWIHEAFNIE